VNSFSQRENDRKGAPQMKESSTFKNDIPAHLFDIIVSRPTDRSVLLSILSYDHLNGYVRYGTNKEDLNKISEKKVFGNDYAVSLELDGLMANSRYYYQFVYSSTTDPSPHFSDIYFFQTARVKEASFSFTIQADSHLDENTDTAIYLQTLKNMASDSADFMNDLGDTWMTDKYRENYKNSIQQYKAQRFYLGSLCKSSALFLTLGNHDGENSKKNKGIQNNEMEEWSTRTRNQFYFNPVPNHFYSGNIDKSEDNRSIANYYSWEWGNALFMVLDPFRYTSDNRNPWDRTLGKTQYDWLEKTLKNSKAKYKFVFIHNLVGGFDQGGIARGGAEAAAYFEWGGKDLNGESQFENKRIGWSKPIHDLLLENHVNMVIHGHDHFFAKQSLGQVCYQLVPQPGGNRYNTNNSIIEYGYKNGTILNAPGYLRVTVNVDGIFVEYVITSIDNQHKNKEILYAYKIK
jgi:UDP-2,3-diacylglucosamine pyrophosphatase LpxH